MFRSLLLHLPLLLLFTRVQGQGNSQADSTIRIHSIVVNGNVKTKERIILRELVLNDGDTLSIAVLYEKLERSRQNLMNTGLFNTVTVQPIYLDKKTVAVEVSVNERWYLWPALIFDLADPNFNTWWLTKDFDRVNYGLYLYQYNLRGRNETAYIKAQFGYTRQFAFRYRVPNLDGRQKWGISLGASYEEQAEITAGTEDNVRLLIRNFDGSNREQWKADVEVTLRRSHDIRHIGRLKYNQAQIRDTIANVAVDYFDGPTLDTRFLTLGYTFLWDQRDSRVFPRSGHYQELRIDRYGLGLLDRAAPNITTAYATTKHWWKVHEKWTLAVSLRGKYTAGTPNYYIQEGLGYREFVRGYEYYVIDGEHFALGKGNITFQLVKPRTHRVEAMPMEAFRTLYIAVYLNLFTDVGRVWDSRYANVNFLDNRWISGNGVGLDLVTSYDQVIRAEYALNGLGEHGFYLHFTQPF